MAAAAGWPLPWQLPPAAPLPTPDAGRLCATGRHSKNLTSATCGSRAEAAAARDLLHAWALQQYGLDAAEGGREGAAMGRGESALARSCSRQGAGWLAGASGDHAKSDAGSFSSLPRGVVISFG